MAKDSREYGFEGEMVMSQLKGIMNHAEQLHDMLEPSTDLPEWVQSKVTLAYDYMQTAADYMATEMKEEVELEEGQKPYVSASPGGIGRSAEANVLNSKGKTSMTFTKKEHGPDYMKKANAHLKKHYNKLMGEEAEELDELSKTTLKSYMNKADARTMDRTIDNPKAHKKAQNRTMGIEKAGKKVAEEIAVNSVGAGNVAGLQGEPPVRKKKKNVMSFNRFMKK
jgi:hypothetical protein